MPLILDGNKSRDLLLERLRTEVSAAARPVHLTVILVGDDPASATYVANKAKACEKTGIGSEVLLLPASTTQDELLTHIRARNANPGVQGILVQLPLPKHIDEKTVLESVDPSKDVDCFHPMNTGALFEGHPRVLPCTPGGIMTLLDQAGIDLAGKHCVVLGRSNIVGKPMAHLFLQRHATVTICHSRTRDLASMTRQADVLCAAIGRPRFVTADMVRPGAVVIDVGINRISDPSAPKGTRLVGDVDYEAVAPLASAITPVPGGVGPMTIATLMQNVVALSRRGA